MKITKEEMDIIRIQAERGGYTPPGQVAKLLALIDQNTLLTRADECDSLADVMEFTLHGTLGADFLRKRARLYRSRLEQMDD